MNLKDWKELYIGNLIIKKIIKNCTVFKRKTKRHVILKKDHLIIDKNCYYGFLRNIRPKSPDNPKEKFFVLSFFDENRNKMFALEYVIDRYEDLPSIIYFDGGQKYYQNGVLHRKNLPAVITKRGCEKYYQNGLIHRSGDYPAVLYKNGTVKYYEYGLLHRGGDMPAIIGYGGSLSYYKRGKLHRDVDKPSIIMRDGMKEYYKEGRLHRDKNLPVRIYKNGTKIYKNGTRYKNKKTQEHIEGIKFFLVDVAYYPTTFLISGVNSLTEYAFNFVS